MSLLIGCSIQQLQEPLQEAFVDHNILTTVSTDNAGGCHSSKVGIDCPISAVVGTRKSNECDVARSRCLLDQEAQVLVRANDWLVG